MKLTVIMLLTLFSGMSLAQNQQKGMDPKMHETHMKCMENAGKNSMDDCMKDKSCKACMDKMEMSKKEEMKSKK